MSGSSAAHLKPDLRSMVSLLLKGFVAALLKKEETFYQNRACTSVFRGYCVAGGRNAMMLLVGAGAPLHLSPVSAPCDSKPSWRGYPPAETPPRVKGRERPFLLTSRVYTSHGGIVNTEYPSARTVRLSTPAICVLICAQWSA